MTRQNKEKFFKFKKKDKIQINLNFEKHLMSRIKLIVWDKLMNFKRRRVNILPGITKLKL